MDTLPSSNESYMKQDYWDERYTEEESYDWFTAYTIFRNYVIEDVKKEDRILVLGCGNSPMSCEMYKDGFQHITNMDYSEVVIGKMKEKHAEHEQMSWVVMDLLDMKLTDESYDVVIEKGTLDAMLVGEKDPWMLSDEGETTMECILRQVSKALKPGGRFISVTFAQPHFRTPVYARAKYNWDLKSRMFGDRFHYFYYAMVKGNKLNAEDEQLESDYKLKKRERLDPRAPVFMAEPDDEQFLSQIEIGS